MSKSDILSIMGQVAWLMVCVGTLITLLILIVESW
jgi:hypothetical protein